MSAISPAIPCEGLDGSFEVETGASDDYETRQYMGVIAGSDDNQVKPLGSGNTSQTVIVGIAQADADDGESVRVRLSGISKVRAEGSVTLGDLCECIYDSSDEDKNGNMKTLTSCAKAGMVACQALEDAADGEFFKAMILCRKQYPAWT